MTTFDKLVVAGTQLVLVPILATRWGLELYGQWLLLATVPQFLSMSDFGFATAAGTRMTMAVATGDRDAAIRIFQSAWRAILTSSALLIALLLAAVWTVPDSALGASASAAAGELRLTLAILAVYGVVAVQGSIVFAGFRAARLFATGAFWNAVVLLIENAALVIAVLRGGGIVAAASAWLAGRLLALVGQHLLLRRKVPWLAIGLSQGNWREAGGLLAPAGSVMLLPLAQALALQGTALVIGVAAGPAAVPVFAAVRTLSRVGMQMCWIVSTPLMPEVSAATARADRKALAALLLVTLAFSALLVVPFACGFMIAGQHLIAIWTQGTIAAPRALVTFMGLAIALGGIWYPVSNLLLACERQAGYTPWYLALALASLPVSYGLVRAIGVSGAGLALAALDFAMLVIVANLAQRTLARPADLRAAIPRLAQHLQGRVRRRVPVR